MKKTLTMYVAVICCSLVIGCGGGTDSVFSQTSTELTPVDGVTIYENEVEAVGSSTSAAPSGSDVKMVTLPLGSWNMETTDVKAIMHGIANGIGRITGAVATIVPDIGYNSHDFFSGEAGVIRTNYSIEHNNNQILLYRGGNSMFENANHNDPAVERGFVTIFYID